MNLKTCWPIVLAILTASCRAGERPASYVIAGPSVLALPTLVPDVWDAREELAIWIENEVARGSLALEGTGTGAFIRIERGDQPWLTRGPDLSPPSTGVRTVRLRYRWQPAVAPPASQNHMVTANCETVTPVLPFDPTTQAAAHADLKPQAEWTEVDLVPGQYRPPIDVRYCYVHSQGANRGELQIDRIELVR
jgi:hypothetical protein